MDDATPAAGDGPRQTSRAGFGPAFCLEGGQIDCWRWETGWETFSIGKIKGLRISPKPLIYLVVVPRVFLIYPNFRIMLKGGHKYLELK